MNDDQLRHNLARRADSAGPAPELLPAVRAVIRDEPQRVAGSRLPAFAGIAAAAAVLLVLVIAVPRLGQAPNATDAPAATGSSMASATEAVPSVAATPNLAPRAGDGFIECAQPVGEIGTAVVDGIGLIEACVTTLPSGEPLEFDQKLAFNPDGDLGRLQVEWAGSACDAAVALVPVPSATGIDMQFAPRPDGRSPAACIAIGGMFVHAVVLQLDGGVDARHVGFASSVTTGLRRIACEGSDAIVRDGTALVESCSAALVDDTADGAMSITNPHASSNTLRVAWTTQDPSECGPEPAVIALRLTAAASGVGYVAGTSAESAPGTGCLHLAREFALNLELSRPINAEEVAVSTFGTGVSATAKTHVGLFDLTISTDRPIYGADEPIDDVVAALVYQGQASTTTVTGVGNLVNGFGIRQLDGPIAIGPGWNEPCVRDSLVNGVPRVEPYRKSGGWSPDDPLAHFYRAFFDDPELRLPVGTYVLTAYSEFYAGECGAELVRLTASVVLRVTEDEPAPSPTPDAATPTPAPSWTPPTVEEQRETARGVLEDWSTFIAGAPADTVLVTEGLTTQDHGWSGPNGDNAKVALGSGVIDSEVPVPEELPPPAEVAWPDGSTSTVELRSAADALDAIRSEGGGQCDGCTPVHVVKVRLTTHAFDTTRGPTMLPSWEFTLREGNVHVFRVAAAHAVVLRGEGRRSNVQAVSTNSGDDVLSVTYVSGACTDPERHTAHAVESELAIVVFITSDYQGGGGPCIIGPGVLYSITLELDDPLGSRTVLDISGTPISRDASWLVPR